MGSDRQTSATVMTRVLVAAEHLPVQAQTVTEGDL